MVIVDTTVWIDYFRGTINPPTEWLDRELDRRRIGLTDLILCEIRQGVPNERQAERTLAALQKFEIYPLGGIELAVAAARNFRLLRSRGRVVRKLVDSLIASFCILNGFTLLHNDRDYDPFEEFLGLKAIPE